MKKHSAFTLLIAAPFAMAAAAAPVEGPDMLQINSMPVQYDAAAVRDSKSAEKLFFRFRQTAEEVCRQSSRPAGAEVWEQLACENEAVADAVRQADIPALNTWYHGGSSALLTRR